MNLDWQNIYFLILFAAAVVHGFYLALLILLRPDRSGTLVWLSTVLFSITALLLNYLLFVSDAIRTFPHLLNLFVPLIYVTGPAFYFFVRKSENPSFKIKWIDSVHLIPLIFSVWESARVAWLPVEVKLEIINNIFSQSAPDLLEIILGNRFNIITAGYIIAALYFLFARNNKNNTRRPVKIIWLKRFSIVFLGLLAADIFIQIVFISFSINAANLELAVTLMYAVSLHILGYVILGRQDAFPWARISEKYSTSPLDVDLLLAYESRIIGFLDEKKPWLNPDFSITDLSQQLSIPKHHISQVLNEKVNMSFYDLINSYRIQEVKERLAAGALTKYSIFGIARDCGFGSKSTFNRIFKKSTGVTPSAYIPHSGTQPLRQLSS